MNDKHFQSVFSEKPTKQLFWWIGTFAVVSSPKSSVIVKPKASNQSKNQRRRNVIHVRALRIVRVLAEKCIW